MGCPFFYRNGREEREGLGHEPFAFFAHSAVKFTV